MPLSFLISSVRLRLVLILAYLQRLYRTATLHIVVPDEPVRFGGVIRSLALLWGAFCLLTGPSNYDRYPKFWAPFEAMNLPEWDLGIACLLFGTIGMLGGFFSTVPAFCGRIAAATFGAALWTTCTIGLLTMDRGLIAAAPFAMAAIFCWRHILLGRTK